jgi:hypothetical protein
MVSSSSGMLSIFNFKIAIYAIKIALYSNIYE